MKGKQILCALLCVLALTSAVPAARAAEVQAGVAAGKVGINGRAINNSSAEYPLLVYRDITYFPMTFHLCRFLGLTTEWDAPSRTLIITRTGEAGDYVPDTGHSGRSGSVSATRVDYPVMVNDEGIDNSAAKYPLLNYSGVTYFPLTWAFAVDSFGWDYRWDAENGLRIDSSGGTPYVTPPIVNPANPPISTGERTDGEMINSASRAWSSAAWGSSPEELTVETEDWSLEGIKKAIGAGLEAHVRGTLLEGRLTEVALSGSFQLPAGAAYSAGGPAPLRDLRNQLQGQRPVVGEADGPLAGLEALQPPGKGLHGLRPRVEADVALGRGELDQIVPPPVGGHAPGDFLLRLRQGGADGAVHLTQIGLYILRLAEDVLLDGLWRLPAVVVLIGIAERPSALGAYPHDSVPPHRIKVF